MHSSFRFLVLAAVLSLSTVKAAPAATGPVRLILWFDTEDYLLPADDDASKRLAEMLNARGIRATFKLVGEKARVLEKRGRQDVIAALKKHDIGYHSDFHSVHPTPSEYLADCGFLDGVSEFVRREGPGAADVRRIFGVSTLSCYGQPGSSWGPQTLAGLKEIGVAPHGVGCYVDEGNHIGLKGKPFWYENAIVVYNMSENYTRMDLHDPAAVAPAKKKVSEIADRLRASGGGLISIFYHPCEWVHRQFWDGVNFSRGENPPREEWKPPPQRTAEETEAAFARFGEYIDHIRAIPGLVFVTADELPDLYADPLRSEGLKPQQVFELATRVAESKKIYFQAADGIPCSASDQFELFTLSLASLLDGGKLPERLIAKGLFGPDQPPPTAASPGSIPWPAFRTAVLDARNFIRAEGRMPARVFIGPDPVSPANFMITMAEVLRRFEKEKRLPDGGAVELASGAELASSRHVAEDTPGLFGGWVIHRENFRAPKILEVARIQAWTLKPAAAAK